MEENTERATKKYKYKGHTNVWKTQPQGQNTMFIKQHQ